ncbi:diguanylate cyclase [Pseudomarimonas arenosa]|uniref:diguanylate cyclase n=1 Tax=Pseudomarimonas arenosa TaxID=2774145 RepID=A0AAW3ZG39_9GAMM|nr:diguanylate cyclase [Pseudomarimonas arenosa]MBD8524289.1 diguanylate cyclase [Pseudomarimonas arenosa]
MTSSLPPITEEKQKLLIVDDEPFNLNLLNALLKQEYKIMVAIDGEQALKCALSARPDLILLDIMMPGIDGHEVCRRLKADERTRDVPIIFISAKSEVADEAMGFDLGAVDYISKPFNSTVVKARVRTHMRLKRRGDLLEKLVMLDGLTMIPNRRALDDICAREWRRSLRGRTPLSALMIDIDHFKSFNDHYGHRAGDECLIAVAQALTQGTRRPGDFVARYGGEEFAAILAETDQDGAVQIAERMQQNVHDLAIEHAHSAAAARITISIGLAAALASPMNSVQTLLETADRALYQAKRAGRNRVCAERL